jgi:hypothetical protein
MAGDVNKPFFLNNDNDRRSSISKFDEITRKFTTSKTVNILHDPHLMTLHDEHQCQRYELYRRHEQLLPNKLISPILSQQSALSMDTNEIIDDLRSLIEHRLPELCHLDGEPKEFIRGRKQTIIAFVRSFDRSIDLNR